MQEDSLTREVKIQLARSIRPTTTGEINVVSRLPDRVSSTVRAILDTNELDYNFDEMPVRPKAPHMKKMDRFDVHSSSAPVGLVNPSVESRQRTRKKKAKANIADLWRELNRFSVTNIGRSLQDELRQNDIHYVNISDSTAKEIDSQLFTRTNGRPFQIPELPSGSTLIFNILSTW
jgi:hypothetical protein